MTAWRTARCIVALRAQVDATYPGRPKQSDGVIASVVHHRQNPTSDHEPNEAGVVTAFDITAAPWVGVLAERLRDLGQTGDARVKYVIWRRRIASAETGWTWVRYTGTDPHESHLHLSVSADPAQYDRRDPWPLVPPPTSQPKDSDVTDEQIEAIAQRAAALVRTDLKTMLGSDPGHPDLDPTHYSLGDIGRTLARIVQKVGA